MFNEHDWFSEQQHGSAFSLLLQRKLHEEKTPFQHIEIYQTKEFGNLMVIDGCIMLTDRDHFIYHEMMTHPAIFAHPNPQRVWIIGGGDCGSLREVLKHSIIQKAVQIEIDERVTRLAEQYFSGLCESNTDPRAEFHFTDGIRWVQDAVEKSVDIIIVDSTDPVGSAEGLFKQKFYRECRRCLGEGGILIQQTESPLFHGKLLRSIHHAMKSSGFTKTQSLYFPQCCYPSGWWSATMAGSLDSLRASDSADKSFATRYYNLEIHQAALAEPEFMKFER